MSGSPGSGTRVGTLEKEVFSLQAGLVQRAGKQAADPPLTVPEPPQRHAKQEIWREWEGGCAGTCHPGRSPPTAGTHLASPGTRHHSSRQGGGTPELVLRSVVLSVVSSYIYKIPKTLTLSISINERSDNLVVFFHRKRHMS